MDALLQWEIQIIIFIQSVGEWIRTPMALLSFLGTEEFYLFVAPALVWCADPAWGIRTGLALMVSGSINYVGKLLGAGPRPYWISDKVLAWSSETSFGVPSAHAQNAVTVWGMLAANIRRRWAWVAALVLAFLIGISRLVLGMHFPHDVLVGWLLGALVLWGMLRLEKPVLAWMSKYKPGDQMLFAMGFSLALILLGGLARMLLGDWNVPMAWAAGAARYPEADPINPLALSGLVSSAGVFFGMAAGAILLREYGWFDARGPLWQLAARFAVGLVGIILLWYVLGLFLPRGEELVPLLFRYIRYTLIGLWVAFGAPITFKKFKIA